MAPGRLAGLFLFLAVVAVATLFSGGLVLAQAATVDYDADADNLIEVANLAQLDAMRWDLDGNGAVAAGDQANYALAFPNALSGMGCAATCVGYELTANLDFDTNNDGVTNAAGDDYWKGGVGWKPISGYTAEFNGDGHTISNLFINRSGTQGGTRLGLFGQTTGGSAHIRNIGLINVNVTGDSIDIGALVGFISGAGTVTSSYATGSVTGQNQVGGLVGSNQGTIRASHAYVAVNSAGNNNGGLVGHNGGSVIASYATGAVTAAAASTGGLVGAGAVTDSYFNTDTTTQIDANQGKTTAELQAPTTYTGIYANWDVDLDGDSTADDPWDFGTSSQYPLLKSQGATVAPDAPENLSTVWGSDLVVPEWDAAPTATSYIVQWKAAGEDYDAVNRQATAYATHHTIPGLTPGTAYTLRVAGVLNRTAGAWSDEVTTPVTTVTIAGGLGVNEGAPYEGQRRAVLGYPLTFSEPITAPVTVYYTYVKAGTTAAWADDFSYRDRVLSDGPLLDALTATEFGVIAAFEIHASPGSPVTTAHLLVQIRGDNVHEPDETVQIRLLGARNIALSSTLDATETIVNDDALSEIIVVHEAAFAAEGETLEIIVGLSAPSVDDVTVEFEDLGTGTATSGTDYTAITAASLTFERPLVRQTLSIQLTADTAVEGNETINLRFTSASSNVTLRGADGSGNLDVTVTIVDEDTTYPAISIAAVKAQVTEGTPAQFRVTANPAPASALDVRLSIRQEGAYAAADELGAKTVTIPASQTTAIYDVPTVDDGTREHSGSVTATLNAGLGYAIGAPSEATVGILDAAPGAPAAPTFGTPTASSLVVNWTAPDNTGGSAIASYDLQYRVAGFNAAFTAGPQDQTLLTATIGSLTANTAYEVQVRAANATGDSPWSASACGSTTVDDAIFSGTMIVGTQTVNSITEWGYALVDYGSLTPYGFNDGARDRSFIALLDAEPANRLSVEFNSRPPPSSLPGSYILRLDNASFLLDSASFGADPTAPGLYVIPNANIGWSAGQAVAVSLVAAPPTPDAPTFGTAETDSLPVMWTAPSNTGGSPITGYDVRYRQTGATDWTDRPQNQPGPAQPSPA